MKKLLFIDACVRQEQSRTRQLAAPLLQALEERYEIDTYRPYENDLRPLTPALFARRGAGDYGEDILHIAHAVADADRLVIAAPFWDMGIPAILKVFFEQISIEGITFRDTPTGTVGACRAEKLLYITTRGMDIPDGSPLEQASPYLRALGWLWGIPSVTTLSVHGTDVEDAALLHQRTENAIRQGLAICKEF